MRPPTTSKLQKELEKVIQRMENFEFSLKAYDGELKDLVERLKVVEKWHEQTEFAKQVLKEYQESHPEPTKQESINTRALVAVLAALAALTTIVLAKLT